MLLHSEYVLSRLKVRFLGLLDVCCASSIVNNCFTGHLINYICTSWILIKLVKNDPFMALFDNCSMVAVHCTSKSSELNIDFQNELNFKNVLVLNRL